MSSENKAILRAAIREKSELVSMLYNAQSYELGVTEYIELQKLKLRLKGLEIADTRRRDSGTNGDTPPE
jgi:hypothetical protein